MKEFARLQGMLMERGVILFVGWMSLFLTALALAGLVAFGWYLLA